MSTIVFLIILLIGGIYITSNLFMLEPILDDPKFLLVDIYYELREKYNIIGALIPTILINIFFFPAYIIVLVVLIIDSIAYIIYNMFRPFYWLYNYIFLRRD